MLVHWMIAHDLGDTADAAATAAAELAEAAAASLDDVKARLVLCHVVNPVPLVLSPDVMGLPDINAQLAHEIEAAKVELQARAAVFAAKHPKLQIESRLCRGPVAATLLEEAERQHVDAIAVGSHNRKGVVGFVLGSVAEKLVHASRRPVLVVKPEEARGIVAVM